jgi:hypothetical protein
MFGETLTFNHSSLPVPLAIAPSSDLAFPYIAILLGVIIAVAALLIVFPSLRKYRRKRNVLIYTVILLVVALLIFQIQDVPKRALVSYGFAGDTECYNQTGNQLVVSCQNHGDRSASFYLVLTGFNASLQVKTQQDYVQTNSTTVKVPFSLQESGLSMSTDSKPVFFTIDENVTEFSFSLWVETHDYSRLVVSSGDYFIQFVWNATENCYKTGNSAMFT